jgi:RNA 3'-terminal phosphate cyclase
MLAHVPTEAHQAMRGNFDVGTAGSITLVLQALLPLMLALH